ncbi:MAG TPA: Uma2 family endonuclease [Ktedonobacterales bacterium]|jgi:Uma2 family endonuclease
MPPTGLEHLDIMEILLDALKAHVKSAATGRVTLPDTGFRLPLSLSDDTVLSPDIAFIGSETLRQLPPPGTPGYKRYLAVAPDLAVEVASPGQHHPEMADKARFYPQAGVRLIWVIWPASRQVDAWRANADHPKILGVADMLIGLDVVPGFTLPVGRLFA